MADEKKSGVAHGIEDSIRTIVKELIAGGVAGGVAKTAVAPFERVKILFQVLGFIGTLHFWDEVGVLLSEFCLEFDCASRFE